MGSTVAAIGLSEYLEATYEPDREYLDGALVERNLGEIDHGRLQILIAVRLCAHEK